MTDTPALSIGALRYRWPGRDGFDLTVAGMQVGAGESVLLLGPSGAGKSTLLALVCGIVTAGAGQVRVMGTDLATLRPGARDRFRAEQIGIIFQQFNLLPWASVLDNVLLPLRFAPARRARAGNGPHEARRLLSALGLQGLADQQAARLSTGQQQRVAVARALIGTPPLIVADEPTSALDHDTGAAFLDLLFAQCRAAGSALLMVSHDERLSPRFDRVLRMADLTAVPA